jgi:hypothetical protein
VSSLAQQRVTSDEFIAWAMRQPETERYELSDGEVLAVALERSARALTRFHIARQLARQIEAGDLLCQGISGRYGGRGG